MLIWITLHRQDNGSAFYAQVAQISVIMPYGDGSMVSFAGDCEDYVGVREPPDRIMAMITGEQENEAH